MIKRERAARIAAENRAIAIQQQAAEERQTLLATLDEERQQAAAERQTFLATLTGERQQSAEERQQSAEERERLMATVTGLMAQVNLLVQQRNGNHAGNDHSPNEP